MGDDADASVTSSTMLSWKSPGERVVIRTRSRSSRRRQRLRGELDDRVDGPVDVEAPLGVLDGAVVSAERRGGATTEIPSRTGTRCVPAVRDRPREVDVERRVGTFTRRSTLRLFPPPYPAQATLSKTESTLSARGWARGHDNERAIRSRARHKDPARQEHLERAIREQCHWKSMVGRSPTPGGERYGKTLPCPRVRGLE